MTEPRVHLVLVLAVFGSALATFLALLFVTAPYGRHHRPGWGPSVGRRLGWLLGRFNSRQPRECTTPT